MLPLILIFPYISYSSRWQILEPLLISPSSDLRRIDFTARPSSERIWSWSDFDHYSLYKYCLLVVIGVDGSGGGGT